MRPSAPINALLSVNNVATDGEVLVSSRMCEDVKGTCPPPFSSRLIQGFCYRPEIDGLRALAVMAVVLFHANLGVPGGFIGVDVFFVISGYLITSLILRDIESGKFTFANFWERRARRILPASVVVVLAVLTAGWFLLMPTDLSVLGKSAASQAVFAANFHFWRNTNYFTGAAEEQPLLHMWSLAVEEQFYFIFPLLLYVLLRYSGFQRRSNLLAVFLWIFVFSLGLSMYAIPRTPAAVFYLLPARAWELICGSIIAIVPPLAKTSPRIYRELLCGCGLVGILIPCFLYSKETIFPGYAALPPCLGAALFIWASNEYRREDDTGVTRQPIIVWLFTARLLVFIGLISYSLYLWHWPLFAFCNYWALEPLSLDERLALVAISFLVAVFSWRFIETPFRVRRRGTTRSAMFAWSFVGLTLTVVSASVLVLQQGFPGRFSKVVLGFDAAKSEALHENRITKSVTLDDALSGRFPRLGAPAPAPIALMVWGDSHARSILPAANAVASQHSLGILTAWHSSTPPVLGYQPGARDAGFSLGNDCAAFNQAVLDQISKDRIPAVLLAARWSGYFNVESQVRLGSRAGTFASALLETVRRVKAAGATPYIFMEVPNHKVSVPKALLAREILGTDIQHFACDSESLALQNIEMIRLVPELESAGAEIVDVADSFWDVSSESYRMENQGAALYYDRHHLTARGASQVREFLLPILQVGAEAR